MVSKFSKGRCGMTVFVCLDGADGVLFHRRRQSRDAAVIWDICASVGSGRLLIGPYSEALFASASCNVTVCEDPLAAAGQEDSSFLEYPPATGWDKVTTLVVYRWNRAYPADAFFGQNYRSELQLTQTVDFSGTSHEIITKEVYVR